MDWYITSQRIDIANMTDEQIWENIGNSDGAFYDLYPGHAYPPDDNAEYRFESEEGAKQYANGIRDVFAELPDSFEIYRAISVRQGREVDLEYLGTSWSLYKENALTFGSHNNSNILLTATIDKTNVDWTKTIAAFSEFTSMFSGDDEWEIVPLEQSQLRNVRQEPIIRRRRMSTGTKKANSNYGTMDKQRIIDSIKQEALSYWEESYEGFARNELGEDAERSDIDARVDELVMEFLNEKYEEIMRKMANWSQNFPVWRALRVKRGATPKNTIRNIILNPIGIYWSYDESSSSCWEGGFNNDETQVNLKAIITPETVNWEETISLQLDPYTAHENKIRLLEGSKITIVEVSICEADQEAHHPIKVMLEAIT